MQIGSSTRAKKPSIECADHSCHIYLATQLQYADYYSQECLREFSDQHQYYVLHLACLQWHSLVRGMYMSMMNLDLIPLLHHQESEEKKKSSVNTHMVIMFLLGLKCLILSKLFMGNGESLPKKGFSQLFSKSSLHFQK